MIDSELFIKLNFVINVITTFFMTGVIWFVQIVHYPLFKLIQPEHFFKYEAAHSRLTTYVVGPMMMIELLTAVAFISFRPTQISTFLIWLGLVLLAAIWLGTFFLSVPQHNILSNGFDATAHKFLVNSNWLRTIAWTLRSALTGYMIYLVVK